MHVQLADRMTIKSLWGATIRGARCMMGGVPPLTCITIHVEVLANLGRVWPGGFSCHCRGTPSRLSVRPRSITAYHLGCEKKRRFSEHRQSISMKEDMNVQIPKVAIRKDGESPTRINHTENYASLPSTEKSSIPYRVLVVHVRGTKD